MRTKVLSPAIAMSALAMAGGAHAQLLGADAGGAVSGNVAPLGTETVDDLARLPAGVDADVRGGAFLRQPQAAIDAAVDTGVGVTGDVRAPAQARASVSADTDIGAPIYTQRQDYEHGSYVLVDSRGWIWVPRGARLEADGSVSPGAGARGDTTAGTGAADR